MYLVLLMLTFSLLSFKFPSVSLVEHCKGFESSVLVLCFKIKLFTSSPGVLIESCLINHPLAAYDLYWIEAHWGEKVTLSINEAVKF